MIWSSIFLALSRSHHSDFQFLEQGIWRTREDDNRPSPVLRHASDPSAVRVYLSQSVARSVARFFVAQRLLPQREFPNLSQESVANEKWGCKTARRPKAGL